MLRMKFWTSEIDVKKCSKRPWDPHNRIRLEKLCPKVVSDRQNAGRMPSKRRFWHFRPIHENLGPNVNDSRLNSFGDVGPGVAGEVSHGLSETYPPPCLAETKPEGSLTDAKGGYGPNRRKPRIWPLRAQRGALSCSKGAPDCWEHAPLCWEMTCLLYTSPSPRDRG